MNPTKRVTSAFCRIFRKVNGPQSASCFTHNRRHRTSLTCIGFQILENLHHRWKPDSFPQPFLLFFWNNPNRIFSSILLISFHDNVLTIIRNLKTAYCGRYVRIPVKRILNIRLNRLNGIDYFPVLLKCHSALY